VAPQTAGLRFGDLVGGGARLHDDPGVCDPFHGEPPASTARDLTEESRGGASLASNISRIGGGSGYILPPDAQLVQGRFPNTSGPNKTLYRANPNTGAVTSYAVYDANGLAVQRVDLVGPDHSGVPTPHVHVFDRNARPDGTVYINTGNVRPSRPEEVP
jgi:hypothetical protein